MADPLSALGMVALAFGSSFLQSEAGKKFIESIVGKLGETIAASGLEKANELRRAIWNKLRGNPNAERALSAAEQGNEKALETVAAHVQLAMAEDKEFAVQVQQIAEEIVNIGKIEGRNIQNVYGDQGIQINDPQDKVITARDNNTFNF